MTAQLEADAREILASYSNRVRVNRDCYSGGSEYNDGEWIDVAEAALDGGDYSELATMLADDERGERSLRGPSSLSYTLAFMRSTYGMGGAA